MISKWYAVRIDPEVHAKIVANGKFGEDMNTVLRRMLKMPPRIRNRKVTKV